MVPEAKWNNRAPRYKKNAAQKGPGNSTHYIWRVNPKYAKRTRADHLALDGQKFAWADPPVFNRKTGQRGHPGSDGHCRCYAEPVTDTI